MKADRQRPIPQQCVVKALQLEFVTQSLLLVGAQLEQQHLAQQPEDDEEGEQS